jgi:DNA-directed RNA polymerase subunit omega
VPSKYTLVHLAARRAREINAYYHSLGEGLGQYTPPLVEQVDSNKPLSIALEEIAAEKIVVQTATDARRMAEEMLGAELTVDGDDSDEDEGADVVELTADGDDEE